MRSRVPPAILAYEAASSCLAVAAPLWLGWRAGRGKEEADRLGERYGIADRERPPGELAWVHGASLGETGALLPVIAALTARGVKVLVTSQTATSASLLARRLPAGARHQYLPLDVPRFVGRFLDHWQPRLALIGESEIWPGIVAGLSRRQVPLVLVNGRLSPRSFARWSRVPRLAKTLLGRFTLCLAQSAGDADRLATLGAPVGGVTGNLKFDLPPPPADPGTVEQLAGLLAGRTVWMAASTHAGEEEAVIAAHARLRETKPGLLTLIAPRHPERGRAVRDAAAAAGLLATLRSDGTLPSDAADIHVVDTVGELGLFFRLTPLVFMGGSLVPHGGQNPYEPARLGTAILHGPFVDNFADIYRALGGSGGAVPVADGAALAAPIAELLADGRRLRDMSRASAEAVAGLGGALARTMAAIEPFLPPPGRPGDALW